MFDKLDDLLIRFEEVLNELGEPGVTDNQEHFQKLMKEQSDLQPIVDTYRKPYGPGVSYVWTQCTLRYSIYII